MTSPHTESKTLPTQYTDVMVDVETTGRWPDRSAILQIGAVRFNLEHQTIDPDVFDRCMIVPPHRFWEEDTREWWLSQKQSVLQGILDRGEPTRDVMGDFFAWSNKHPSMRFWAKPTSFDFMFIQSYFMDHGYPNPYHYRVAKDVNSWVHALHFPHEVPTVDQSDLGDAHNAFNDCLYQIEFVFNHYNLVKKRNIDAGPMGF